MDKIKRAFRVVFHSPYLPLCILAVAVVVAHLFMSPRFSDDLWFYEILEGKEKPLEAWIEFLKWRYEVWSSRSAIEGALILLVRAPIVWKIIDSVAIIYIVFELSRLTNPERSLTKNIIISLMLPIFPVWVLYEVGFVATSINYIIPFACLMPTISILLRRAQKRIIPLPEYIIAIPLLIFACFSELISAILLIVSIGAIVLYVIDNKRVPIIEIVTLSVAILLLIYHMTCPGNDVRYEQEVATWLPEHTSLNLIEKAILGFNAMTSTLFLYAKNILVVIFCASLSLGAFIKSKKWYFRVISLVGTVFSAFFGLLSPILTRIGVFSNLKAIMDSALHSPHLSFSSLIMVIISVLVLASMLTSLWIIINDTREYILLFFALATGAISKIALGLSPTVWTGSGRATTYLYIAIAIATGAVIYKITECLIKSKKA